MFVVQADEVVEKACDAPLKTVDTMIADITEHLKVLDESTDTSRDGFQKIVNKSFLTALVPKSAKLNNAKNELQETLIAADQRESVWPGQLGVAHLLGKKCIGISVKWGIYSFMAKADAGEDFVGGLEELIQKNFDCEEVTAYIGEELKNQTLSLVEVSKLEAAAKSKKKAAKKGEAATASTANADEHEEGPGKAVVGRARTSKKRKS